MSIAFVIAIVGPTASGKTDLSIELANDINGEIISCDSVQIYQGLDIGSAKPPLTVRERVPHHCIDVFSPVEKVSAGRYKQIAEKAIQDIWKREKIPIVVGGTGLYFNALYYGLFEGPPADEKRRAFYASLSLDELIQRAKTIDPEWMTKNQTQDRRRLTRLLEVYDITGEKLSTLQAKNKKLNLTWHIIAPHWTRTTLYERINSRVLSMLEGGLIEETHRLRQKWGKDAPALQSLGYKQVALYLDGLFDYDTMKEEIQRETRRYAKRQLTWFRKIPTIHWFPPEKFSQIKQDVLVWIDSQPRHISLDYVEGSIWP